MNGEMVYHGCLCNWWMIEGMNSAIKALAVSNLCTSFCLPDGHWRSSQQLAVSFHLWMDVECKIVNFNVQRQL